MKKIFHDIIPDEKRSIRNIRIEKRGPQIDGIRKAESKDGAYPTNHTAPQVSTHSTSYSSNRKDLNEIVQDDRDSNVKEVEPAFLEGRSIDFKVRSTESAVSHIDSDFNKKSREDVLDSDDSSDNFEPEDEKEFDEWRKNSNPYIRASIVLFLLVLCTVFGLGTYFKKATITIKPVKHEIVLKEQAISLASIDHEIQKSDFTKEMQLEANSTVKVERKTSGKVVLYNAFSSTPQKLVANTRLQTPNGLIYRLKDPVSIPGQTTVNGKKVPGSVEASIEADQIGESYNQGLRDFSVVAYKGTDRYEKVYGRSKTALAGGYNGEVPNIAQKDINSAVSNMREQISKDADEYFSKIAKEKPGYLYIESSKKVSYSEPKTDVSKDGKKATVKLSAVVTTPLFVSNALFKSIIDKQQTDATDSSDIVYTGDTSSLKITVVGDNTVDSNTDAVQVSGTTTVSSAIDSLKIAKAVSGLSVDRATLAIKNLVELDAIEIEIFPWWVKKLPSSDKIELILEE